MHSGRLRRELRFSRSTVDLNLGELGLSANEVKPLIDAFLNVDGYLGLQGTELILLEKVLGLRGLTPAVQLVGELVSVKSVTKGTGISYGHLAKTTEPTNLGLVALGFSDGIPRSATNQLRVEIQGKNYRSLGRIAMDQCVVDLGADQPSVGSEVHIFTSDYPLIDLAKESGFTPLEILGRITARVTRTWCE